MGFQEECGVLDTPGQIEELLPQLPCRLKLAPPRMKQTQSPQCREELRSLSHLLTQLPRPGICLFYFRAAQPLVTISAPPRVICSVSSFWARSGVSGRVLSSSRAVVRCPIASALAERCTAWCPARYRYSTAFSVLPLRRVVMRQVAVVFG